MKAKFIFEGRNRNFDFDKEDTLKDIITKNTLLDIDDFNFKFNGKLLEPKELLDSQLGLREDVEEIEINVEKKMKQGICSNSMTYELNTTARTNFRNDLIEHDILKDSLLFILGKIQLARVLALFIFKLK